MATEYYYDHQERLLDTWKTVTPASATPAPTRTLMAHNVYNEIGQLYQKRLHSTDSINYQQTVAYKYNPRGWLSSDSSSLFYQRLLYTEGSSKQYNGNIAYQEWKQGPAGALQTYNYQYDAINRLTRGALLTGAYRETVGYSNMGNIETLRRAVSSTVHTDSLNYTYSYNKLTAVTDLSTDTTGGYHSPGTVNYTYDGNGNLIKRKNTLATNKANNLDTITYNTINLPRIVKTPSGQLTYTYDASGRKLRTVFGTTATDYIDGIEWEGTKLNFIQTEEGRAVNTTSNGYAYEYFLKDHLGNTRSGFAANSQTTAKFVSNYYPFGLSFGQGVVTTPKNRYLYNGKELQDGSNLYDYGARSYDPVIGRWATPDPLSELAYDLTPYRYCFNNPINYLDPFGLWETTNGGYKTDKKEDIERFMSMMDIEKNDLGNTSNISQITNFIKGEMSDGGLGTLSDGSKLATGFTINAYRQVGGGLKGYAEKKSFDNFWHSVQGDLRPEALDPRTIGRNIGGLSYNGPDNPKKYNGEDDYSYIPSNPVEYPAIIHDLSYKKLNISGLNGLLTDKRSIKIDFNFVKQQFTIGQISTNLNTKLQAYSLGIGLGLLSLPKTVIKAAEDSNIKEFLGL